MKSYMIFIQGRVDGASKSVPVFDTKYKDEIYDAYGRLIEMVEMLQLETIERIYCTDPDDLTFKYTNFNGYKGGGANVRTV